MNPQVILPMPRAEPDLLRRALSILALTAALSGCRGEEVAPSPAATASPTLRSDVSVTEISLGRAVGADRRVAQPRDVFAPNDTVYASVVTEGSGRPGRLAARWTQNADVVVESSLDIAPDATTVSEFHISKPNGLARGGYEVEIFLDGASAGKRSFSVE
jgi:uncharacterized protein YfaS (alpha-2-macroglobulin family)